MKSGPAAVCLSALAATGAAVAVPQAAGLDARQEGGKIEWGACSFDTGDPTIRCGNLTVPLDYLDDTSETIQLELIKKPAPTQPAPKGSILLNFGGPGQDGLLNFLAYLPLQGPIIGDQHDIISWDPRGTRNTLSFVCWDDPSINGYGLDWYDSSSETPGKLWSEVGAISELCYQRLRNVGRYVGMASVARDMMAIVDALDEDGISGGTTLGSTVAAMFPDRIDRLVLDGVMNVHQFYHDPLEVELFSDTDAVLRNMLAACFEAGPKACPLAARGKNADDLFEKVVAFLEHVKSHPVTAAVPETGTAVQIGHGPLLNYLFIGLYRPYVYPNVSLALDFLMNDDPVGFVTIAYARELENLALTPPAPSNVAPYGIRCGDKETSAKTPEDFAPWIRSARENSKYFYGFATGVNALLCAGWKFDAVERYDGDFRVKTKNPILFVGNSFDPVTPLVSARNMSDSFQNAVLLEHGGHGHCSFVRGGESDCTKKAIHNYLLDGKLPRDGAKCEPNHSLVDIFNGLYKPEV